MPAKIVMIILPACVVVSAQGSEIDWKRAPRVADCFHDLQEITGGARHSVELPDGYNVALAQLIEHPVEFRPVTVSSRDFLTKDSGASGLFERFELNRQLLIFGGDASIAYFHHAVTKSFAKYIAMETHSARHFREADLADLEQVCAFRET
jgi:hypothetical protein